MKKQNLYSGSWLKFRNEEEDDSFYENENFLCGLSDCLKWKRYHLHQTKMKFSVKVGLSPSIFFLFTSMIALKRMMKNAFYFISSSFRSQDILTFVLTFWSCRKNGLIGKIRLISKFRRHGLVNKQLQYTCCSISHELKVTKQ